MPRLQKGVNDLLTWCKNNGEQGERLIQEWTGITEQAEKEYLEQLKEYEGLEDLGVSNHEFDDIMDNSKPEIKRISMEEMTKGSKKKVKWKCSKCNHEWFSTVKDRVYGCNCPVCAARAVVPGKNDLYTWCLKNGEQGQRLIQEWAGFDENNNCINIDTVARASGKKVRWRCRDFSHEWLSRIIDRTQQGHNCPVCAYILRAEKNSTPTQGVNDLYSWCLQNGEQGESLIQEWTGLDEEGNSIKIDEIARGSKKKIKWKCSKCNHEWFATIANRTSVGSNCPVCAGRAVVPGFNDLMTWCKNNGAFGEKISKEWVGLDENDDPISIYLITKGSNKKVKWKCGKCKHVWVSTVVNRILNESDCPACANQVVIPGKNDLYTWCSQNKEEGQRIISEWTGLDENNNPIDMYSVTKGSHRKVKWKCGKCNHEWISDVNQRTQGYNCQVCGIISRAEKRSTPIQGVNDLYNWCLQNGERGQRLKAEFTGLDENNNPVSMDSVAKGSNKKVKWKCSMCKYKWFSTINSRTYGQNCPACANQVAIPGKNDLYIWCLQNGERGQRLISEWVGLDEDNNSISIDTVTRGSNKKVHWKCKRGHEWVTTIYNRTSGCNCPVCNPNGTSYPEQLLYHSLKQIFPNTISRGTFNNYEYDIAIPELKTCIEYSGYYYHQDKLARDTEKYHLCKKHGVHFIQIYCHQGELFNSEDLTNILHTFNYTEDDLDESDDLFTPNLIIYQQSIHHDNQLKDILSFLLNQFNHSIDEIDFDKATKDAMKFIEDTIDNECESDKSIGEYKGI